MIYFITVSPGKSLCVCALKEKEDEEEGGGAAAAAQDESVSPAHWISIEGGREREGKRRKTKRAATLLLVVASSSQSALSPLAFSATNDGDPQRQRQL